MTIRQLAAKLSVLVTLVVVASNAYAQLSQGSKDKNQVTCDQNGQNCSVTIPLSEYRRLQGSQSGIPAMQKIPLSEAVPFLKNSTLPGGCKINEISQRPVKATDLSLQPIDLQLVELTVTQGTKTIKLGIFSVGAFLQEDSFKMFPVSSLQGIVPIEKLDRKYLGSSLTLTLDGPNKIKVAQFNVGTGDYADPIDCR